MRKKQHRTWVARLIVSTLILAALGMGVRSPRVDASSSPQQSKAQAAKPPETSPIKEFMHYAQLPDGRLMGISSGAVGGVQEIDARYSNDNGYSWSAAETLFKLPQKKAQSPPWGLENTLVDRDGEVHLFLLLYYTVGDKGLYDMRYDMWHVRSFGGVKHWTAPNPVWQQVYAGDMLSLVQLRSGRIVLPLSILTPRRWENPGTGFDEFTFMGRFGVQVAYSDDDGDTWHHSANELKEATPYIGADGGIEPTLLQLNDNRVRMLIRTQWGRFFETYSEDGSEWSAIRPTNILGSDSPAAMQRLKDGRIVMLWNNCNRYPYAQGGRAVLHAAISEDDGQTWRGYREVARDLRVKDPHPKGGDYGVAYIFAAMTKDQKIIFSSSEAGPTAGSYNYVVEHVDPEWLYATHQEDDFSAGLKDWSVFGTKGVDVVASLENPDARVLQMEKTEPDWPSAAVWNFPMGKKGILRMKVFLKPGFKGARIGLTDHFSVPFEDLDSIYNLFNFSIGADGRVGNGQTLEPGQWHDLRFEWDCDKGEALVSSNDGQIAVLHETRETVGASYLRLVSTADPLDPYGLLVKSVDVDVSKSW